jgi:hypothetical protein
MTQHQASEARRFTWLVDVFYDHKVKLIATADCAAEDLYTEGTQASEFKRTVSRLTEMNSRNIWPCRIFPPNEELPMKRAVRWLLACCLSLWVGIVVAQQMEIIQLRSKTVDEVLPALLPLVEPGGTLTGMNDQLFLKASARNREEIKRVLAAMDKPSRRLIIRISQNRQAEDSARGGEVSGQVTLGSTRRSNVAASVWDTKSVRGESAAQMVQTIEGGRAFIQVGRSLAVPMRQTVVGPGAPSSTRASSIAISAAASTPRRASMANG